MDTVRVLAVGGGEADIALMRACLQEIEDPVYQVDWIAGYASGREALRQHEHDAYLVDERVGAQAGVALVREALADGCGSPIFLLNKGSRREQRREAMDAGAVDCLAKEVLTADSLDRALRYGIREKQLVTELKAVREQLEQFRGIIPICMYCHRLRSDSDAWQQVDAYLEKHAGATLSHGICPSCWKETVAPHLEELGCEDLEY
ncbi:MAG: response regulator [Actinomycetota bacterium]